MKEPGNGCRVFCSGGNSTVSRWIIGSCYRFDYNQVRVLEQAISVTNTPLMMPGRYGLPVTR